MAPANAPLPDPTVAWVGDQAEDVKGGNAKDHVRDLSRRDQDRQNKIAQFQKLITDGIESGVSTRTLEGLLMEARQRSALSAEGLGREP